MEGFQERVAGFVKANGLEASVEVRLLDLMAEVGELAKEALASTRYGRRTLDPGEGWAGELGDVLFSLACIANSSGVDLEAALDGALQKYERRLAARGDAGSASDVV
ncbi:MAG: nucleotide pyrophosphohydrolase [Chloroflexota bacterium]|nr:nucleotide pyrophosphohydrolase [Chloroflexota bacterium]